MTITIRSIRIHPGIGIARFGDSDEFFIGPEAPGIVADPGGQGGPGPKGGSYRDADRRLKRQAQRFRVYGYDSEGNVVAELTSETVTAVRWRAHVRNMKAANYAFQGAYLFDPDKLRNPGVQPGMKPEERSKLIVDPGVHVISSGTTAAVRMAGNIFSGIGSVKLPGALRYEGFVPKDPAQDVDVTYHEARDIELGQLRLDSRYRLLFVPGPGRGENATTPKISLSNPSEWFSPPNGPEGGSNPLTNQFAYFNVPGWWDDSCCGEIDVTVQLKDGTVLSTRNNVAALTDEGDRNPSRGAWIVTAPPKFSPHMYHVVSILDRVYEAFPESYPHAGQRTDFYRDIYPIFVSAVNYGWVSAAASGVSGDSKDIAHGPDQPGNLLSPENMKLLSDPSEAAAPHRQMIHQLMRQGPGPRSRLVDSLLPPPPARPTSWKRGEFQAPVEDFKMPKLWGTGGKPQQNEELGNNLPDQFLALTDWQLRHFKNWAEGNFDVGKVAPPVPLGELPLSKQPHALDCSALEPTIGGGFHPGIEFPYLILYREYFAEAFRVAGSIRPGSVSAYMSSPWHGDFWSCNHAWWPTQRPDIVFEFDRARDARTYREWFRGYDQDGVPLSGSDGYHQMVYAWSKLGMVLPLQTGGGDLVRTNGAVVFVEEERDPALNRPPRAK